MSSKKETVELFVIQLKSFAEVLRDRFPEETFFRRGVTMITAMKTLSPEKSIKLFINNSYKHREHIMAKDERSLLSHDYTNSLMEIAHEATEDISTSESIELIGKLKQYWHELDDEEKENMWKYLQVLVVLTDKYLHEKMKTRVSMFR
jgi:two-component SAPR family response regulator